jgi:3-oxoacyl-[acyl-carrier protein] reductase
MELGIKGHTAIVCASSRGLGKGCAMALAQAGVDVVINGRDAATLERTAEEIRRATGVQVTPVVADVATEAGQRALLAACPQPDILVNNNGGPPFRDFRELDRQAIFDGLTMNMVSAIELIQKVIEPMAARGFGRIVNITSISVRMPVPGLDLSSGARAGLTAFVGGVARSYADRGVTINNLLPGYFDTDRMRSGFRSDAGRLGGTDDSIAAQRLQMIPAKRFGNPDEFGQTCAFLCSQHAAYITGQSLLLDGGLYRGTF